MATRKALNYDIDVNLLKQHYPNQKNYRNAWRDIKRFLAKRGFVSRQYSGVASIKGISVLDAQQIIEEMSMKHQWFPKCVQRIDITSIGEVYDLKETL